MGGNMGEKSHFGGEDGKLNLEGIPASWGKQWDSRAKLVSLLVFVMGVIFLDSLLWTGVAFVLAVCALVTAKIPLSYWGERVRWVFPFLLFVFLGLLLGRGVEHLGDSAYLGGTVSFKALASLTATVLVLGTQPVEEYFRALSQMRLPPVLVTVLLLSYRYTFLFREMVSDTFRGLYSRGFEPRLDVHTLKIYGETVGILFLKALDRSEVVLKSMEARGFDGGVPFQGSSKPKLGIKDLGKTLAVFLVVGCLIWMDRGVL